MTQSYDSPEIRDAAIDSLKRLQDIVGYHLPWCQLLPVETGELVPALSTLRRIERETFGRLTAARPPESGREVADIYPTLNILRHKTLSCGNLIYSVVKRLKLVVSHRECLKRIDIIPEMEVKGHSSPGSKPGASWPKPCEDYLQPVKVPCTCGMDLMRLAKAKLVSERLEEYSLWAEALEIELNRAARG